MKALFLAFRVTSFPGISVISRIGFGSSSIVRWQCRGFQIDTRKGGRQGGGKLVYNEQVVC